MIKRALRKYSHSCTSSRQPGPFIITVENCAFCNSFAVPLCSLVKEFIDFKMLVFAIFTIIAFILPEIHLIVVAASCTLPQGITFRMYSPTMRFINTNYRAAVMFSGSSGDKTIEIRLPYSVEGSKCCSLSRVDHLRKNADIYCALFRIARTFIFWRTLINQTCVLILQINRRIA